jgi:hypothetical protein
MFKLQLQYNRQGDWIDTVYPPRAYADALALMAHYNKIWSHVHEYRIISTGASR